MKYEFISTNRNKYTVEKMCKALKLSKNSYYNWVKIKNKPNKENPLKRMIKEIFYDSKKRYGSIKVQKMLERKGYNYSTSWVAYLMKEMGLRSIVKRKFIATTDSKHKLAVYPNLLNREFNVKELGKVWVSDITYVKVKNNWNYLTTIMDLSDRKIIGYSISDNLTTKDTLLKAWNHARLVRNIKQGFIFHSDRGVQFASNEFTQLLIYNQYANISMSRKANCWDNAVAESFFKTIKCEYINHHTFNSLHELKQGIIDYIHWYNNKRIHQNLNYLTPSEMEQLILNKFTKIVA